MDENVKIIEIGGVKLEVDMRTARKIESFKVGDAVKILIKQWSDNFKPYFGMIVGFDMFTERPTIIVAYLDPEKPDPILFAYLNKDSKDIELCMSDLSDIPVERSTILERMDVAIQKKRDEISDLENKKQYFLKNFSKFFEVKK